MITAARTKINQLFPYRPLARRVAEMSLLAWSLVLLWILVLGQGLMVVAILRHLAVSNGHSPSQTDVTLGSTVAAVPLVNVLGDQIRASSHSGASSELIILFVTRNCRVCDYAVRGVLDLLAAEQVAQHVVYAVRGSEDDAAAIAREHGLDRAVVVADVKDAIGRNWGIGPRPYVAVCDREYKLLRGGPANSVDQIVRVIGPSYVPHHGG